MLALTMTAVAADYVRTATGLRLSEGDGALRIDFVTPDIVRVRFTQETDFLGNNTGVCVERADETVPFTLKQKEGTATMTSDSLVVSIDLQSHAITYTDACTGKLLLAEAASPRTWEQVVEERVTYDESTKRKVLTADGEKEVMDVLRRDTVGYTWKMQNHFRFQLGESLYGLGAHMEDYLDLRGKTMYLVQHNLKAVVPVLNSTAGYGLLFDAGCSMLFSDEDHDAYMEMEAVREIDYYLMKGATMDRVVAQYRRLTGQTPMLPQYMLGYIQSRERFHTSREIVETVEEYRRRQVPLDLIVQDWNYWPQGWGWIKLDPRYYPNAQNLTDSVHALNAHIMISIWPNAMNCPQNDDFKQRGFLLQRNNYDVFNPLARRHYWKYVNDELFSKGFDAWWCDCSEPLDDDWTPQREGYGWDSHRERWQRNTRLLSDEMGPERALLYSLYHARGIYENQRATTSEKRVANLTRSSYAGQQRYATITWNGDTHATWQSFRQQIPAGLNFMAAGCNWWTVDIGAFFARTKRQWFIKGDFDTGTEDMGFREFYTRMFQWGTFLPLQRSHGTDTQREIWNFGEPGTPFYDAILRMIDLRYQLLPYNYSLADRVSHDGYTMTRLLAFDFADDPRVRDIKDEYMFGPALLVCPVTSPMYYGPESTPIAETSKTRPVYLPKGSVWYDFWSDRTYRGGQTIEAEAPIDRLPLFVRAGSIVPMGPVVQYAAEQQGKELTIHIYAGADADFTLYADEGDSYRYEQGECARIPLHWNDKKNSLTIGERQGSYRGMSQTQSFRIVMHREGGTSEQRVTYSGKAIHYRSHR